MKILVIHNSYLERGGEDEVVKSEIKLLKSYGHEIVEYRRSNKEMESFSFLRKIYVLLKEIIWSQDSYEAVKELIIKEKPDIAHIHNIFLLISPSVYYALSEGNVPIVQTLHNYRLICPKGILYRNGMICEKCLQGNILHSVINKCWRDSFFLTSALARILCKFCKKRDFLDKISAYVALGDFSKKKFVEAGFPSEKVFIKPNFVDIDTLNMRDGFEDYAVFVGRLVDYKGVLTLVDAFKTLGNYHLKIIGDGPLLGELKTKIEKIETIDLLGRMTNDKARDYMRRAAFTILPSECYESTPRVIIESFSCGVPVLVSNRAFKGESVEEHNVGLEFIAGDSNSLADKVRYLMENRQSLAEMGKNAFIIYQEKYTAQKNYESLIEIYNKAIELHEKHKNN